MSKRTHSTFDEDDVLGSATKRSRNEIPFSPITVATAEVAAAVDLDTPFQKLTLAMQSPLQKPHKGKSIIYWMRMNDLRIRDNRAFSQASVQAQRDKLPLLVVFIASPQDYLAHDRAARRIDFILRNLKLLKNDLSDIHIPLHVEIHKNRSSIPSFVVSFCKTYRATAIYANIEYEIDEIRRDLEVCERGLQDGIQFNLFHNKSIIEPGIILTKQKKAYTVYSPYRKMWLQRLNEGVSNYLMEHPSPMANESAVRSSKLFGPLFNTPVPSTIDGFDIGEAEGESMKTIWPEGEDAAAKILNRFLTSKARPSQLSGVDPLGGIVAKCNRTNRIEQYDRSRDKMDQDTTSRLSAYLTSGVISAQECVRAIMRLLNQETVEGGRNSGIGRWVQELAWRDFYTDILAFYPRVSMGRPYQEKFSEIIWEKHQGDGSSTSGDSEAVERWKNGTTGVPIVDAAMRCLNTMGWLHNRGRMIAAMYLTKNLMIDWRVGERYFMQQLIDGDLSSNNGGWQWSASTGVDACPYFRIFNPYTQSAKTDPNGDFIRHYVPELRSLKGSELHNPSAPTAKRLGYHEPMIAHKEARERALRRFKNPGQL